MGVTVEPGTYLHTITFCECELRNRRWNPQTFLCETCGNEFQDYRTAEVPPIDMRANNHILYVSTVQIESLLLNEFKAVEKVVRYATADGLRLAPQGGEGFDQIVQHHTGCMRGHRGIWFYDPMQHPDIRPGDHVLFKTHSNQFVAKGIVTGNAKASDYPKYCSANNSVGILWEVVAEGKL